MLPYMAAPWILWDLEQPGTSKKCWSPPAMAMYQAVAIQIAPFTSSPQRRPKLGSHRVVQQRGSFQELLLHRKAASSSWGSSSFPWQNESKSPLLVRGMLGQATLVGVKHWMVQHLGTLWAQNPLEIHFSLGVHHGKDATLRAQPGQSCLKTCSMSIDAIRESGWKPELIIWNPIPPHPTQSLS